MFSRFRTNFLTGALAIIPLAMTFWILYFIIDKMNLLLLEPIENIFEIFAPAQNIKILTKVVIFCLLLALITLVGFATRIIILRNIFGFGEKILYKVPMINIVYKTIKEISSVFMAHKDTIFKKVVLVEYPRNGIYQLGFIISETKGEAQVKTKETVINVFIPTTPNPTSGILVLVPKEQVIQLDMSVSDGMKMIISGGALVPQYTADKHN